MEKYFQKLNKLYKNNYKNISKIYKNKFFSLCLSSLYFSLSFYVPLSYLIDDFLLY